MEKKYIEALGKMTYGIYVLTTFYDDKINGMIASWVSQISYDPPLIMAAIHPNRYSHHLIEQNGSFALHVLAKDQADFLSRFKGDDPAGKFEGIQWSKGKTGCPILKDCVAFFECTAIAAYTPGNHTVFIAEIVDATRFSDQRPLITLDYQGQYLGKT
jgi:flavin reductase (DIM6/NTAB) family NADH-FMN oxidoreductase RutF